MKEQIRIKLYEYNVNTNLNDEMNWFTIRVNGIPRSVIQEFSRHRLGISPSIQSTRFVLKRHIKGKANKLLNAKPEDDIWGKYIWLENDTIIDTSAHRILSIVADKFDANYSTDKIKTLIPEGLLTECVYTMDLRAWRHLYSLRSSLAVYEPFRLLVEAIKETLERHSDKKSEIETNSTLLTGSTACRTCWDSHSRSDFGGSKDLELLKRVGIHKMHASILEHLIIRRFVNENLLREMSLISPQNKFLDYEMYNGKHLLKFNMRTVVDLLNDINFIHKKELISTLPEEYLYLVEEWNK